MSVLKPDHSRYGCYFAGPTTYQSIAHGTTVAVPFTVVGWDVGALANTVGTNGVILLRKGRWLIDASITWNSSPTSTIRVAHLTRGDNAIMARSQSMSAPNHYTGQSMSAIVESPGTGAQSLFHVGVYHEHGAALQLVSPECHFSAHYLGPLR